MRVGLVPARTDRRLRFVGNIGMPSVMIRRNMQGQLMLYIAKKDLEVPIVAIEHERVDCWGGILTAGDGVRYYIEPFSTMPSLPVTVRVRRLDGNN